MIDGDVIMSLDGSWIRKKEAKEFSEGTFTGEDVECLKNNYKVSRDSAHDKLEEIEKFLKCVADDRPIPDEYAQLIKKCVRLWRIYGDNDTNSISFMKRAIDAFEEIKATLDPLLVPIIGLVDPQKLSVIVEEEKKLAEELERERVQRELEIQRSQGELEELKKSMNKKWG